MKTSVNNDQWFEKKEKLYEINYLHVIMYASIFLVHLIIQRNQLVAMIFAVFELFVLVILTVGGRFEEAFIAIVIVLTTSLEVNSFVFDAGEGTVYTAFRAPVIGGFGFVFLIIILCIMTYQRYRREFTDKIRYFHNSKKFIKLLIVLYVTAFFTSLITYITNDNGVQGLSWYTFKLFTTVLSMLSFFCFFIIAYILLISNDIFYYRLTRLLIEMFISGSIVSVLSVLFRWHGYYGNETRILLMPLAMSLCPILILFSQYVEKKYQIWCWILGLMFIVISFSYSSLMGSKYYFVPLLVLLIFFFKVIKKKKILGVVFVALIGFFLLMNYNTIFSLITNNSYNSWKFTQLLNFLNVFDNTSRWYYVLPNSPRYRIDEFVNIFLEYRGKPWYVLFGKGLAGSITKKWGLTDWTYFSGNFDIVQIESGVYIDMHESINILFLKHGLYGIIFFLSTIKNLIKQAGKSLWFVPAMIWMVFYWGGYESWKIGAIAVAVCIYNLDREGSVRG